MSGIYHSWDGTVLTITSDAGTSSADLKGDDGVRGPQGAPGILPVEQLNEILATLPVDKSYNSGELAGDFSGFDWVRYLDGRIVCELYYGSAINAKVIGSGDELWTADIPFEVNPPLQIDYKIYPNSAEGTYIGSSYEGPMQFAFIVRNDNYEDGEPFDCAFKITITGYWRDM